MKLLAGVPAEVEVTDDILDELERDRDLAAPKAGSSRQGRSEHVATQTSRQPSKTRSHSPIARTLLESMVEATGRLNMDEDGNYDYSGNSSGLLLVERIRQRCDSLLDRRMSIPHPGHLQRHHSGTPSSRSLSHSRGRQRPLAILPTWDVASKYLNIAFRDAFSLFNFIHKPSFEARLHEFYQARNAGIDFAGDDMRFEGLLYALFALAEQFAGSDEYDGSHRATRAYVAIPIL